MRTTGAGRRFTCEWTYPNNEQLLIVTDTQTGQATPIPGIAGGSTCPTESDPTLTVWRRDDAGRLALWTGPFDALAPAQLDVAIVPYQPLIRASRVTYVLASAPGDPLDLLGMYRIDLATLSVTVVIPATLADATWAPGAVPGGALVSSKLSYGVAPGNLLNWSTLGGRFIYERAMADGTVTMFIGPYDPPRPRELALFTVAPGTVRARDSHCCASPAALPDAPTGGGVAAARPDGREPPAPRVAGRTRAARDLSAGYGVRARGRRDSRPAPT